MYVQNRWDRALSRDIFYSQPNLIKGENGAYKYQGMSVRCVRNAEN